MPTKYSREYYLKNKEKRLAWNQAWKVKNPNKVLEQKKRYRTRHKEDVNGDHRERAKKNKAEWMKIVQSRNMDKCSACGYDKSFAAIDFHHVKPEEKEFALRLHLGVTEKRLAELNKCVSLCSNCHRELHERLRQFP